MTREPSFCTCHIGPRGRENTVGCRVHHLMPDGCIAADHEVICGGCGEFFCDHDCLFYADDDGSEDLLCCECGTHACQHGCRIVAEALRR